MRNLVGDHVPTEQEIEQIGQLLADVERRLAPFTTLRSATERRSMLKMRIGGERIVALLAEIARKYRIDLPDMPLDGMERDVLLAQRVRPLRHLAALLAQRLADTELQATSEAWEAATGTYTVLSRLALTNLALAIELAPVKEFFARRRKAPLDPTGTTEVAEVTARLRLETYDVPPA